MMRKSAAVVVLALVVLGSAGDPVRAAPPQRAILFGTEEEPPIVLIGADVMDVLFSLDGTSIRGFKPASTDTVLYQVALEWGPDPSDRVYSERDDSTGALLVTLGAPESVIFTLLLQPDSELGATALSESSIRLLCAKGANLGSAHCGDSFPRPSAVWLVLFGASVLSAAVIIVLRRRFRGVRLTLTDRTS